MSATDSVFDAQGQMNRAREVMSAAAERYRSAEQSGNVVAAQVASAQYRAAELVHDGASSEYRSAMAEFDKELEAEL